MNLNNMKKLNQIILFFILCSALSVSLFAQQKNKLLLSLNYHNVNNYTQYLQAQAKSKVDGKLTLVPDIEVKFYINTDSASGLLGKAITDDQGNASIQIPASARAEWDKSPKPSFLAEADESKSYTAGSSSFDLTKARLKIDTSSDKKIIVTLTELKDASWTPVKGVDVKIAVKRQGGDLTIGDAPTYTTDSLGIASTDYSIKNLPGDTKGSLILVAKVEDNDTYGNLSVQKSVPWGVATVYHSNYDKRTLFARRGRGPVWLDFISYSIIVLVWGVLMYLIFQIRRLKKLGTEQV
jgi:hypothetical protein